MSDSSITELTPEERLKRYSKLFRFNTDSEIDANELAEHWNVHRNAVVGMINAANNSKKLCDDLRALGFEDIEFPTWWYSPARDERRSVDDEQRSVE